MRILLGVQVPTQTRCAKTRGDVTMVPAVGGYRAAAHTFV